MSRRGADGAQISFTGAGGVRSVKKVVRSGLVRAPRLYDLLTSQPRYRVLYAMGRVHEPDFRLFPQLLKTAEPLVLDVGGNLGQSVLSIMTVLPRSHVITFEPNPVLRSALDRLTRKFAGQVSVEGCGLSAREGVADLYWPVYNGRPMLGLASFDQASAASWLGPKSIYGFQANRLEVHHTQFAVRTLDSFDLSPQLIKIDVQGLESEVIAGAIKTIRRSLPVIMAEDITPSSSAIGVLSPLGYRLWSQAGRSNAFLLPPGVDPPDGR